MRDAGRVEHGQRRLVRVIVAAGVDQKRRQQHGDGDRRAQQHAQTLFLFQTQSPSQIRTLIYIIARAPLSNLSAVWRKKCTPAR